LPSEGGLRYDQRFVRNRRPGAPLPERMESTAELRENLKRLIVETIYK
jgi:hypothetical protein